MTESRHVVYPKDAVRQFDGRWTTSCAYVVVALEPSSGKDFDPGEEYSTSELARLEGLERAVELYRGAFR
ncbi:MAG TPA: hypothetical protein EYP61_00195 [Candidatus Latescibacteria bacterium]|nr:hypothetical protein [Candidatus Latescibacterota bacterium]